MKNRKYLFIIFFLPILIYANNSFTITANQSLIDNKKSITIFSGNVNVKNDSINIIANKIEVKRDKNNNSILTAYGSSKTMVIYENKTNNKIKKALALKMVYLVKKKYFIMTNNVTIYWDNNTKSKAQKVTYDINLDKISFLGNKKKTINYRI